MTKHGKQARLEADNAALRAALEEQWSFNHFEHCGRDWPHPPGRPCHWPRPALLDGDGLGGLALGDGKESGDLGNDVADVG